MVCTGFKFDVNMKVSSGAAPYPGVDGGSPRDGASIFPISVLLSLNVNRSRLTSTDTSQFTEEFRGKCYISGQCI